MRGWYFLGFQFLWARDIVCTSVHSWLDSTLPVYLASHTKTVHPTSSHESQTYTRSKFIVPCVEESRGGGRY